MKKNKENAGLDIYKINIVWRLGVSIGSFGVTFFGIYYLYDSIVSRFEVDIYVAIALILMGIVLLISHNYFRLILTETSLKQQGIFFKREVVFDRTLELNKLYDGSYILSNSIKKINITIDIDRITELIEKLKVIIQKLGE